MVVMACGLPSFGNRAKATIVLSEVKLESLSLVQFCVFHYILSHRYFFFLFSALLLLFKPSYYNYEIGNSLRVFSF